MDVVIRSFARPFHLERCLLSLRRFVTGTSKIIILDDGTPHRYLERLRVRYPEAQIERSPRADEKAKRLETGPSTEGQTRVPNTFWYEQISLRSPRFLLLDDDMWFTRSIDLEHIETIMTVNHIEMLKLFWLGAPKLTQGEKMSLASDIEEVRPVLPA